MLNIFRSFLIFISVVFAVQLQAQQQSSTSKNTEKEAFINDLMSKMTIDEKIGQLNLSSAGTIQTGEAKSSDTGKKIINGKIGAILNLTSASKVKELQEVAVTKSRLKIPLLFGLDVIHGYKTTFPIPLALASSWDMSIIEKMARVSAIEASADGICWTFSPMVDIARDPRWGRIAEGAGEDAFLGSKVAQAYVIGYQGNDLAKNNTIMACVKHFALYGAAEAGRDYNTTDMSFNRMYNEYLPPYKAAFDAGAGSAMSSFNDINGVPATANRWLMTDLLRNQWGFKGFVVTDYTAIDEMVLHGIGDIQTVAARALNAGIDMDMVGESFLNTLKKSLIEGKITETEINQACRRILEAKYDLGLFEDPYKYCDEKRAETELATSENMKTTRKIASQTFVLLKNQNQLLPLKKNTKIALIGPLADSKFDMVGMWAVGSDHTKTVSVLEGFQNAVENKKEILYAKGCNIVEDKNLDSWIHWGKSSIDSTKTPEQLKKEALKIAKKSDVIVAVMGEGAEMTGESASRSDISLPENQEMLLKELKKTGKPIILVLFTGRPLTINWEKENIPAILNVWFGGSQAGNAIADAIFGDVNPSGKLTVTFPQNVGQIPIYYNHKNTGRPIKENEWFKKYRSNYLDVSNEPLYPFGYGLSYTTFNYSDFLLSKTQLKGDEILKASVTLTNSGKYDGAEVVQLYIRDVVGSITRPVKELKGFQKIFLKVGESKTVSFDITPELLKFYNNDLVYDWEPGEFDIMVGGNSHNVNKKSINWEK
ncbi:Periplasmic beta-glucosidase [uncultured Paludibacter sp.]|uniref:Periplasmic beta-glucosidase n=1 Tax=uncultured Paludibacter sp. TaxID=497635 RepID=A0A653A6Y5_9BACT|nr:Periplasmic beta-glucosidase [uncultured Paludibacter sp.]